MYELSEADRAPTQAVAEWIAGFSYAAVPEELKNEAGLVLLDTLGVMLASTQNEVGRGITKGVAGFAGPGPVAVPFSNARVDVSAGAVIWGTLGHGLELDEVHLPSQQHIGATVCAAALAMGQHVDASIDKVREATLVGYEISGHLGIAVNMPKLVNRGFHLSAVVSGFGCAAAAARLLGSDAEAIYAAMGLTQSQASGTLAWHTEEHHMSKSFHMGVGARNGITGAILGHSGYRGPVAVFAGPRNFIGVFVGEDNDPNWVKRLGKEYEIHNSAKKLYAAGRPMHAALDALLELMRGNGVKAEDIDGLEIRMPPNAASIVDGNPTKNIDCITVMATAAIDECYGQSQGEDVRMEKADVQEFKKRTRLIHDPALDPYFPQNWPAEVIITLKGGRELRQTQIVSTGSREKPMSRATILDKFRSLCEPAFGASVTDRTIDIVLNGKDVPIRDLAKLYVRP